MKKINIYELQRKINTKLAEIFKANGIKNFRIISVGNSIATGYSMVRTTKPLLLRNESLEEILAAESIRLDRHSFARAQNNNDRVMFNYLVTDKPESEVNKEARHDFSNARTSMPVNGLTEKDALTVYAGGGTGLQTLATESSIDLANVIVYNGATGSFLDGVTRKGTLLQKFTRGINRDVTSIDATLEFIQDLNREKNSNTQVYLCGAPNLLGLGITTLAINRKLKKLASKFANVIYVEPINSKVLYGKVDKNGNPIKGKGIDIHYDEEEYVRFNNNIFGSISENYTSTQSLINLDRSFVKLNKRIELEENNLIANEKERKRLIAGAIEEEMVKITDSKERIKFLKVLKKYMTERFPYDFYYLGKKDTFKLIDDETKNNKVA